MISYFKVSERCYQYSSFCWFDPSTQPRRMYSAGVCARHILWDDKTWPWNFQRFNLAKANPALVVFHFTFPAPIFFWTCIHHVESILLSFSFEIFILSCMFPYVSVFFYIFRVSSGFLKLLFRVGKASFPPFASPTPATTSPWQAWALRPASHGASCRRAHRLGVRCRGDMKIQGAPSADPFRLRCLGLFRHFWWKNWEC